MSVVKYKQVHIYYLELIASTIALVLIHLYVFHSVSACFLSV